VPNADESLLYVADPESHIIRVIDMETGTIDLLAGSPGEAGDCDGVGTEARFNYPTSFALDDETGELFVADANNHKIRVIDVETGAVSTYAGITPPASPSSPTIRTPCTWPPGTTAVSTRSTWPLARSPGGPAPVVVSMAATAA